VADLPPHLAPEGEELCLRIHVPKCLHEVEPGQTVCKKIDIDGLASFLSWYVRAAVERRSCATVCGIACLLYVEFGVEWFWCVEFRGCAYFVASTKLDTLDKQTFSAYFVYQFDTGKGGGTSLHAGLERWERRPATR